MSYSNLIKAYKGEVVGNLRASAWTQPETRVKIPNAAALFPPALWSRADG